jgi:uncharacterized caspase-like protein
MAAVAASLWAQPLHAASDRVALVIGNGAYENAGQLANPANDAADVAQALRRIGFDVVEGRDLAKRDMEGRIREFGHKLDNASLALFFYAGHGLQVSGRNYLVPVDAKLDRPADLNFEAFDLNLVLQQMEADKRVNLVFLDACRDNPLARSLARSMGTRSAAVGRGLASTQGNVGTMIAYATQPDNVAMDGQGRNSPFTTALLKYIDTPGLEVSSLMKRVRSDVVAATRDRQVPWDHSSLTNDVVLVPATGTPQIAAPQSVVTQPVPSAPAPPATSAAIPVTPAPTPRSPEPDTDVPAFTNELLKREPAIGHLPTGATALVDDGTCPRGKIKKVVGGDIATGKPRKRSCIARP